MSSLKSFLYSLFLSLVLLSNTVAAKKHIETKSTEKAPLKLSADKVEYKEKKGQIQAFGHVKVSYQGNIARADKLTYHQKSNTIEAEGNVQLLDNKGNKIYTNRADLSKDFSRAFAEDLYIETPDKGYFFAKKALKQEKQKKIIFNNASYTSCKVENLKGSKRHYKPKASWMINANKIVWDQKAQMIRFVNSSFDFFSVPLLWLPYFAIPDQTVKRKSGFLAPSFSYRSYLGFGIKTSYFFNLSPSYDFTFSGTIYKNQGILGEQEWRQRFENGFYNFQFAYISQRDQTAFDKSTIDFEKKHRWMTGSQGLFEINPNWQFGWDILVQSDKNFSKTYAITPYDNQEQLSKIFLTGLKNYNYFNLALYHFNIQESLRDTDPNARNPDQPFILPHLEYNVQSNKPVLGGTFNSEFSLSSLYYLLKKEENSNNNKKDKKLSNYFSSNFIWEKRFISKNGLIFNPSLAFSSLNHLSKEKANSNILFENMITLGLELDYPLLIRTQNNKHILEPVAQLFVSNNENEKFVQHNDFFTQNTGYSALNLFQRNRYLAPNRREGGNRINAGIRYSSQLQTGWIFYSILGQSYHLSGVNGISETPNYLQKIMPSDIVGLFEMSKENLFSLSIDGNLDSKSRNLQRSEISLTKDWHNFSFSFFYNYNKQNLMRSIKNSYKEIGSLGQIHLSEHWTFQLDTHYDLIKKSLTNIGTQINYQDTCFSISLGYAQTRNPGETKAAHKFDFSFSLKPAINSKNKF